MLVSNEFVKEEHKYRGKLLRDQYQTESRGRAGKSVAVLVVAGAIALAACGTPADSGNAIEVLEENRATDLEHAFSGTEAPVPQGSRGLLSQILGTDTVDLEMAFSGVAAPAAGIGAIGLPQAADPEAAFSGIEAPVAQGKGWSQAHADPASGPR